MGDNASISSWTMPDPDKHSSMSATSSSSNDGHLAWADGPFALLQTPVTRLQGNVSHPVFHVANETAHLYNAMLRALNAIYQQAPYIQTATDVADFSFLVHSWAAWVLHHMELRSNSLFPDIEAALLKPVPGYRHEQVLQQTSGSEPPQLTLLADLLDEQATFLPALRSILQLGESNHLSPETYDHNSLIALLIDVGPPLQAHMNHQIHSVFLETIHDYCGTPGSIAARVAGDRLLQCYQASDSHSSQNMDRFIIPPMMVRCRDITYESGHDWPGLPVPHVHAIADRLSRAHKGSWRFLPCDVWGRPVELFALVAAQQQGLELDRHLESRATSTAGAAELELLQARKGKAKVVVVTATRGLDAVVDANAATAGGAAPSAQEV